MQLIYSNPEETVITVTLDAGETLGNLHGPVEAHVPTDPMNSDFAAILAGGFEIEPYVGPPTNPIETPPPPDIHDVNAQVQDIDARLSALEETVATR